MICGRPTIHATAHVGQHVTDALIDFFAANHVWLKGAMDRLEWTDGQRDQIRISWSVFCRRMSEFVWVSE